MVGVGPVFSHAVVVVRRRYISLLEKLAAMQCTDEEVAAWFGVNVRTIERNITRT
jgi:hypothetical protein